MAAGLACCALAASAVSVPTANAEDLKDRQKKVQKRIEHADSALEDSSARVQRAVAALEAARASLETARGELDTARTRLAAAKVRDAEMKAKLAAAEQRLADAEAALNEGRSELADQRVEVVNVINETIQGGDPELVAFASMLNAQTSADLTRREEVRDVIVGKEDRAYDDLRAAEVLLEVHQDQVAEARDEVEVQREAAAEHLVTMRGLHTDAQEARAQVRDLVHSRRDLAQDARSARAKDRAALAKLRQQEKRIKQKILAAARRAARRNNAYHGDASGFLSRPVAGIITSPFGYRIHPIYHYYGLHNGTDFRAPCGTAMRAPAAGRVIASYWSSVYGNRLFVGLGMVNGRYLTAVYNHATRYTVGVGDNVGRGEVIGYSGDTGWSTACHLHFEILANGTPVNPMNWM